MEYQVELAMKQARIIYILDILLKVKKMDMALKYGMIKQNMKENGKMINSKGMVYIIILMERYIWANGIIIIKMDMEN